MTKAKNFIDQKTKFRIAYNANFACGYCGAKCPYDEIQIDHQVPASLGGSNEEENLVAACVKCNQQKSDTIAFPRTKCMGLDDGEAGWLVLRSYGNWKIIFSFERIGIEHKKQRYFVDQRFAHDPRVIDHVTEKSWVSEKDANDFCDAVDHLRKLTTLSTTLRKRGIK